MSAHSHPETVERSAHAWLAGLNPEQLEAATYGACAPGGRFESGPLLVIAGAGTGKTATLSHRVAHLVLEGIDPERILLLTFSRRAAREMIRRAERLVAQALGARGAMRLPWSGTFHAVGARLLRQYAPRIGLHPDFGIIDRGDAADLIDLLRHELGLSSTHRRFPRKDTCLAIYSHRVNTGQPLAQVLERLYPWCVDWQDQLAALFRAYVAQKQANGVLDYDDLLLWWDAMLVDETIRRELGARFDHVLVDEYQDTNALQARILFALKPDGRGLAVVGDDAQSIYGFRAAEVGNILGFPERFRPPAHKVTLEQNYRSVQPVLDTANALMAQADRQHHKTLRARRTGGARPRLVTVIDDRAQADWVIDQVLARREEGVELRRQAVLFRSSHHSALLEVELTRRNVPFVKHGGLRFVEAAHVKDALAVLRWADNPRNGIAGFRALQLMPGFGPAHARRCLDALAVDAAPSLGRLADFAAPAAAGEHWPRFVALVQSLAAPQAPWSGQLAQVRTWYQPLLEQRYDDATVRGAELDMLEAIAAQFGSRERFLTELALDPPEASGALSGDPLRDEDYLILSTVHSAKGQEWDAVYLLNVADGNFPNEYATGTPEGIAEERRLLYVALTRARDVLHLVEPQRYYVTRQARTGDAYVHGARSRFLSAGVLATLEQGPAACADVAARLRAMW